MATSSADPEDLDRFAARSAEADRALRDAFARVRADYAEFAAGTDWAVLDADGLLAGFLRLLDLNDRDVAWSRTVASTFRRAGRGGGVRTLPDVAVEESLKAAGLSGERADLTVDLPEAYGSQPTSGYADDPVNTASGNFLEVETDLALPGVLAGLTFARTCNSRDTADGVFGRGWTCWADARLLDLPDGAHLVRPDGARVVLPRRGDGWARVPAVSGEVERAGEGLAIAFTGGERWEFDADGLPARTTSGPGTGVRFLVEGGRVVGLAHEAGRTLRLEREGDRVVALVSSDGRRVDYAYDDAGRLVGTSAGPKGPRTYRYGDDGRVAAVVDADGVVEVDNAYDAQGRVVRQVAPSGRVSEYTYLPGRVTVVQDDAGDDPNTWVSDPAGRLVAVVDAHGGRQSTSYDAAGDPVLVTDRRGGTTLRQYDARRRLVRQVTPLGAEVALAYDDLDRVVEVLTSTGLRTVLRYDGEERTPAEVVDPDGGRTLLEVSGGLVRSVTDPDGVRTRLDHDADGLLVGVATADGGTARLERDPAGRVTASVAPSGRRTTYAYDEHGWLRERVDPDGAVWRFAHSPAGRLLAVVDPTGARRAATYGADGLPARTTDPLGGTTARTYDDAGNLSGLVLPDGAVWRFVHDGLSRLVEVVDPAGGAWRQEHDAGGAVVATVDPSGVRRAVQVDVEGRPTAFLEADSRLSLEHDVLGRAVAEQRTDGSRVEVERDGCGRVVAVRDAEGGLTRVERTPGGRPLRLVRPSGSVLGFEHDALGRLCAVVDGLGGRTELRYDEDGRVVTRTGPDGRSEHLTHDAAGRLASRTVPGAGTTAYGYDAAGRLVATTDPVLGRRRFTRDAAGRLVEAQDANGGRTRYDRDAAGRVVRVVDPLGAASERHYDEVGRTVASVDPLGLTTTGRYDAAGRLVEQVDGAGRHLRWTYDDAGRMRSLEGDDGTRVVVERDVAARTLRVVDASGTSALRWDACDRLVSRRRGDLALAWRYDADGARRALVHPDGRETAYEHDAAGRLVRVTHPALGPVHLQRDPAGRLLRVHGDGVEARWQHGPAGVERHAVTAGGVERVTEVLRDDAGRLAAVVRDGVRTGCAYDPAGQLVAVDVDGAVTRYAYDAAGRLVRETAGERVTSYSYDDAGRLVQVQRPDGSTVAVEHDGAGRRTRDGERTAEWDARGCLTAVRAGGRRTALEVDGLGELVRAGDADLLWDTADPFSPLVHAGGVDLLGAGGPWAVAGGGDATWLGADDRGTPVPGLDPWGAGEAGPALPAGLALGLHGELLVEDLLWLRARPYDPGTRGFLAPDPLPPVPGAPWCGNPWSYAGNDPLGASDPLGLRPITDAEFDEVRAARGRNVLDRNREVVLGTVMVAAGGALLATGVGGPAGMALLMAGGDIVIQKATTGQVDYRRVAVAGVLGGAGGALRVAGVGTQHVAGLGAAVGGSFSTSSYLLGNDDPTVAGALASALGGAVGGAMSALAGPASGSAAPTLSGLLAGASRGTFTAAGARPVVAGGTTAAINGSAGAANTLVANGLDPDREVTARDLAESAVVGVVAGGLGDRAQRGMGHSSPSLSTLSRANGTSWGGDQVLVPAALSSGIEMPMTEFLDIRDDLAGDR